MAEQKHHLAAIMFTDIVGYTAMMGDDEGKAMHVLEKNLDIHKQIISRHGGSILKQMGDGILSLFESAIEAVRCAIDLQAALAREDDIKIRTGIHIGDVITQQDDVFGDGVNIASRIMHQADETEILVSASIYEQIRNQKDIGSGFLKEELLKNVSEPVKMYRVWDIHSKNGPQAKGSKIQGVRGKIVIGLISAITIATAFFLIFGYPETSFSETTEAVKPVIAVLAFDDQSPKGDHEWLGDGVAEQILNVLAKQKELVVIGRTSSFSFKGEKATIKEISEELNAQIILEGSVNEINGQYRITSQLIDASTESHIWTEKYDREGEDLFNLIDEVAQKIASSLIAELTPSGVASVRMEYQPHPKAFEYFQFAEKLHEDFLASGLRDSTLVMRAHEFYIQAIESDPKYVDAYVGLANLYDSMWRLLDIAKRRKKIDSLLSIAYAIDQESPGILYQKALRMGVDKYDSAFYLFNKAYLLDPYNDRATHLVQKLFWIGLHNIVIEMSLKHLERDPFNKRFMHLIIQSSWYTGRIDHARRFIERLLKIDPKDVLANQYLFQINCVVDRNTKEANNQLEKLLLEERDSDYYQQRKNIVKAISTNADPPVNTKGLAIQLILNQVDVPAWQNRMDWNRDFAELDWYWLGGFTPAGIFIDYLNLTKNPIFSGVREDPNFQEWISKAKVIYEERMQKYGAYFMD